VILRNTFWGQKRTSIPPFTGSFFSESSTKDKGKEERRERWNLTPSLSDQKWGKKALDIVLAFVKGRRGRSTFQSEKKRGRQHP